MNSARGWLRKSEKKELVLRPQRLLRRVNEILEEHFNRMIPPPKKESEVWMDGLRLTRLVVWQEVYKVDLEWILQTLVPVLRRQMPIQFRGRGPWLGIPVRVLTSRKAEEYLREQIAREFPRGENESIWDEEQKQRLLERRWEDAGKQKLRVKKMWRYPTVAAYVRAYQKRIELERRWLDGQDNASSNRRRRYRGSPWW